MELGKDLVAASATPLVLTLLAGGDSYGYAIIKRVSELSGGQLKWTDGMLYPVLHRLEQAGLLASRWVTAESGRRRRVYALTKRGNRGLAEQRAVWEQFSVAIGGLLGATRPWKNPA